MIHRKNASSIIEVIVTIVVLTVGIIGAYTIISRGQNLTRTTEKRIQAINIAREWIEAVQNIRDTNWLLYSSDYEHCWWTANYNPSCVWDTTGATKIIAGSYILTKDATNKWLLDTPTSSWVYLDGSWLIVQWWVAPTNMCTPLNPISCKTIFTRTLDIGYTWTGQMDVTSNVRWYDENSSLPHLIQLKSSFTNWKAKN